MKILVVEDNPAEARLIREVFSESAVSSHVSVVSDGVRALTFLRREGEYTAAARPDLILLDQETTSIWWAPSHAAFASEGQRCLRKSTDHEKKASHR